MLHAPCGRPVSFQTRRLQGRPEEWGLNGHRLLGASERCSACIEEEVRRSQRVHSLCESRSRRCVRGRAAVRTPMDASPRPRNGDAISAEISPCKDVISPLFSVPIGFFGPALDLFRFPLHVADRAFSRFQSSSRRVWLFRLAPSTQTFYRKQLALLPTPILPSAHRRSTVMAHRGT
jgi:hypothetical protein